MSFFFSRDTKVFMKWSADSTTANTALYEIPVLDGFSFSQATNTPFEKHSFEGKIINTYVNGKIAFKLK